MKQLLLLVIVVFTAGLAQSQIIDSLNNEKLLREKILNDIQQNLEKKNQVFDSTIMHINERVDNLDSAIKMTTSVKVKADKLVERVQALEDKQRAQDQNEMNIYQANYQSAIVNLVSMQREIKPLILFNTTREFFTALSDAGNPMNYNGYTKWFNQFKDFVKANKQKESMLTVSNNLLNFSGSAAQAVPVVGPISSVLFSGMSTYVNSLGKKEKELRTESEKMITLTAKVGQFDYDKSEVEHEWKLITDELNNLQKLYGKSLEKNLHMLDVQADDFNQNFSQESDAEKRYQYLTALRQKASDYVAAQKSKTPKDWKENVYNEMMAIQSLKMRFGQLTFRINENIAKYADVFNKYKDDPDIGGKMTALQNKLNELKDTFDKAFDPLDYINSASKMYKVM
ncbi:hypothetical protein [Hydrotalea sp.]|uniref:hypothetical protein n=1 Tax=Hydrotalea sp. TaxID=2881279 RepID=UPI003D12B858